ncbi:MAG: phosphoglycerate kinase [Candidatus Saccharibacteria bacterium]|nr:phosphoglycerate kinase [Candidatus Saccharibacteria bacterium]
MAFSKQTIQDIDLKGKKVLLRADYNVPVKDGKITADFRVEQSVQTVRYLLDKGAAVVICSHLGRPKGEVEDKYSLKPVQKHLSKLLDTNVAFAEDCIGDQAEQAASKLAPKEVLLLENLRFHPEEEQNDAEFAKKLVRLADIFVQDGFGVVHRAHASTDAITKYLPSVAGLLLEQEVSTITEAMNNPKRPLMAIVGGAKIADKIDVLKRFIDIADFVVVGGAMANTFLLAKGIDVAKSKVDREDVSLARDIMQKAANKAKKQPFIFYTPQDGVVANKLDKTAGTRIVDWDAHVIADIESYPKTPPKSKLQIHENEMVLDIGPVSGAFIAGGIQLAGTVIWNGAMGVTELEGLQGPIGPFAHGTEIIVDAMLGAHGNRPFTLVGGGDTVGYIESRELTESFDHVSTGGGAGLDLMSGKKLPGVEALLDK